MNVSDIVRSRGIEEVLHFTTNSGVVGSLAVGAVLSRTRLPQEKHLEHIWEPNSTRRERDPALIDYVNLSISRVNAEFLGHSRRWHRDEDRWWAVLAFDPEVLDDPGVLFVTTNNIYTGAARMGGGDGLEALFAPKIARWAGNTVARAAGVDPAWPTCPQAEALYPKSLSLDRLSAIYVDEEEHVATVSAQLEVLGYSGIDVRLDANLRCRDA